MNNCVLVTLADKKFLNQAKQLFSTAYWNSGWNGDYLLLAYDTLDSDLSWFINKKIIIRHCKPIDCGSNKIGDKITASKCYLFEEYFKKWKNVVYLDVDILTRGSLVGLAALDGFNACYSLGQTIHDNFINIDKMPDTLKSDLSSRRINIEKKAFNSGVMAFSTSIITHTTFVEIIDTFNKYVSFGLFGGDQLPFNIFFYNKWHELPSAYNQIVSLNNDFYNTKKLSGIVIHCVSFGNGPWDQRSVFYEEWFSNFCRSDKIDLNTIPEIKHFTHDEIGKRSKEVNKIDMLGGTPSFRTYFLLIIKIIKTTLFNPFKIFKKIKLRT